MRIKAVIAYDGSKFYGFQKQTSTTQTVAYQIEKLLKALHIDTQIIASGRTDRGVHASNQIIHFDIPSYWQDIDKLKNILNHKLNSILFKHMCIVENSFHARFDAKSRVYRYVFSHNLNVFEQNYISFYPEKFDKNRLDKALYMFIGKHDFRYFHKTGSNPHSTIREIYKSYCIKRGKYHYIYLHANGFLRSQVRMIVDASLKVAQGKMTLNELEEQINNKHQHTNMLAPAQGLYLARILY